MNINKSVIEKVSIGISNWEYSKVRSIDENWSSDEYEKAMSEYENILDFAENEHGMKQIGEGRDRIVFTSGNVVSCKEQVIIKISRGDGGKQNREEIEMWETIDENIKEYVAPIIKYDKRYTWIIQQKANTSTPPCISKELTEKLAENGWVCSDISPDNVGRINGKPVLIDLGIGLREI